MFDQLIFNLSLFISDQWIKKMKRTGITGRNLDCMIAEGVKKDS